jgi:ABC-2 type transport system permease protein
MLLRLEGNSLETMKINTINELEKLLFKRGMKIHFILVALLPFLILLATEKVITNDMLVLPAVNMSYAMLKGFVMVIIPLFSFVAVADLFASELEKGTLFFVRPIKRSEIYFSKITALSILIALQLVLFFTITAISMLLLGNEFQVSDLARLFFSTLISWLPLLAITVLAAFIAQFVKSSAATVGIGIFIYLAMFVLPFLLPGSLYLFPTAYLDWFQLWNENVSYSWMIQSSLYLISFISLFFSIGYYMFKRKEV